MVSDVVSLVADLVKIPSICGEEKRVANFVADWLEKNHLPVQTVEVKPNRPDVITRLKGEKPGPHILLNGHMDTVEVGNGWTRDPFGAQIEDGKMYGRGAIDMKSGLASILWAAAACRQEGGPRRGELIVTAVVDEEALDWGTYALVQKGLTNSLDFAMISEPTDLKIVTAHRGRTVFDIVVHGKAAHSMWPDRGVSAIVNAATLINSLPKLGGPTHPTLGRSTVNVLKVEGGQEEVMLVSDRCRVVIDRCLVPGYGSKEALEDLRSLIKELGVNAEAEFIARETPFCDPFEIPEDNPAVKTVSEAATKVLGKRPEIGFHEGPCDSCILVNQGRVSTIEFGPSGGRVHEPDEFVYVDSVRKTAAVYYEILKTYLS